MSFQHPYWLAVALMLLVCFFLIKRAQHRDDWFRLIHKEVLGFLGNRHTVLARRTGALLFAALAAVALANPSVPSENAETFHHSEGWFVLADVSRSMTLDDIAPSRLSAMRDIATRLAGQTHSRPVSLIIYAGDAFMITPPAFDTQHFIRNAALMGHESSLDHSCLPADHQRADCRCQ